MKKMPELLAPAGNMDALRAALHFGADAVYAGMKRFGLRAFAGNLDADALREAVSLCHAAGRRFYVTLNALPFDEELAEFLDAARAALAAGVDAAIVSDLGAIAMLRRELPQLPVHVSTQASTVNTEAVRHYAAMGCQRVILARELSLRQIAALRQHSPAEVELECFVHGASCMAYSGRCLLSAVLTGRSGNRGSCAQPCRWQYAVMEQKRPGEYLPVAEDARGTYIFSAKDLCLMPLLPQLCQAGVSSLKIEGRMKTEYYVAVVTAAYRRALDALEEGEACFRQQLPALMEELRCASHRDSDTGFLEGPPAEPGGAEGFHQSREYVARALTAAGAGETCSFLLKNRFFAGETLELLTPQGVRTFVAPGFVRCSTGELLTTLGIAGEQIDMALPFAVAPGDLIRGPVRNHRQ